MYSLLYVFVNNINLKKEYKEEIRCGAVRTRLEIARTLFLVFFFLVKGKIPTFIFLNETSCVFSGGYRRLSSKPCKGEREESIQYSSR